MGEATSEKASATSTKTGDYISEHQKGKKPGLTPSRGPRIKSVNTSGGGSPDPSTGRLLDQFRVRIGDSAKARSETGFKEGSKKRGRIYKICPAMMYDWMAFAIGWKHRRKSGWSDGLENGSIPKGAAVKKKTRGLGAHGE